MRRLNRLFLSTELKSQITQTGTVFKKWGITKTDTLQRVIQVQAPQFSKVSMAIQLKEDLKASDVLASFLSQIRTVAIKREDLCLYEIGGNIGARCLNDETYMKDLYQLNPNAEWVIKSRSC